MEWMLMPLKRYADFSGRSRRMEYWMWVLFQFLIGLGFSILIVAVAGAGIMSTSDPAQMMAVGGIALILYLLYMLVSLIFLIPSLAVTVRRLHDTNRSGWWILGPIVPYLLIIVATAVVMGSAGSKPDETTLAMVGLVFLVFGLAAFVLGLVLLVFLFLEGTKGPNQYGPDPKSPTPAGVFS